MARMRKNRSVPFLLAMLGVIAPSCAADPPDRAAALAALDPIFEKFMAENHVPGLVYGVVADGKLLRVRAFGIQDTATKAPVTADTVFRIASMSKQVSALATLKLRDAGKLELDAPAERYIPELANLRYPTTDSPKIRVRDLLSHSAGFVTDDPWGDRQLDMPPDEFTRFIAAGLPLSRAPGTDYEYSNTGFALVGRIITNRAGMNYADYIGRSFLAPLGMTATGFDITRVPAARRARGYRWEQDAWREEPQLAAGEFGAMGGLITSANDYAKYVAWVLAAWPPRDGAEDGILNRASVREIVRPQTFTTVIPSIEKDGCPRAASYGFGMNSGRDCVIGFHFGHSGGLPGFGSNVAFVPDRDLAVFAFANRTYTPAGLAVRASLYQLVRSGAFPVRPVPVSPGVAAMAAAALRIYEKGDVTSEPAALAENLLLDRGAELRNAELAQLRQKVGACAANTPPAADHALSATLTLDCERGKIKVTLLLAPTSPASLQRLEYTQP
jgi:D-alanyl-D-alanine-carboxypeptidase/D-alanyl-D-alanine-endopeptidase